MEAQEVAVEVSEVVESPRQRWKTPLALFKQLNNEYNFTVDAAAEDDNALLDKYWTRETDALKQQWVGERVFCNPPWKKILPWIQKALKSEFVAMLVPNRTGSKFFLEAASKAEIHFFRGRVQFQTPGEQVKQSSNPYDTCLMLFGPGTKPGTIKFRDAKTGKLLDV